MSSIVIKADKRIIPELIAKLRKDVTPAKAGLQKCVKNWIPAFAGIVHVWGIRPEL
jgi:hypothetical protein